MPPEMLSQQLTIRVDAVFLDNPSMEIISLANVEALLRRTEDVRPWNPGDSRPVFPNL